MINRVDSLFLGIKSNFDFFFLSFEMRLSKVKQRVEKVGKKRLGHQNTFYELKTAFELRQDCPWGHIPSRSLGNAN